MRKNISVLFLMLAFSGSFSLYSAPIDPQLKQAVSFIYQKDAKGNPIPIGTCFFVSVPSMETNTISFGYIVTAKHVLMNADHVQLKSEVLIRVNKKDGKSEFSVIPIKASGKEKSVFFHNEETVDIAVVPFGLQNLEALDVKFIPSTFLATDKDLIDLKIEEGSDVFFTGLFIPYPGYERGYPIVRFGKVALFPKEKIMWNNKMTDLYLLETTTYGGNSGSPVYFYLGPDRKPGTLYAGSIIKLAGIMTGFFGAHDEVREIEVKKTAFTTQNMGIAAVTPAQKLHDILYSTELKELRGNLQLNVRNKP